jgi:hypothetical protein
MGSSNGFWLKSPSQNQRSWPSRPNHISIISFTIGSDTAVTWCFFNYCSKEEGVDHVTHWHWQIIHNSTKTKGYVCTEEQFHPGNIQAIWHVIDYPILLFAISQVNCPTVQLSHRTRWEIPFILCVGKDSCTSNVDGSHTNPWILSVTHCAPFFLAALANGRGCPLLDSE